MIEYIEKMNDMQKKVNDELEKSRDGWMERRIRNGHVSYNLVIKKNNRRKSRSITDNEKILKQMARKKFLTLKKKEIEIILKTIRNSSKKIKRTEKNSALSQAMSFYPEIPMSYFLGIENLGIWDGTQQSQNDFKEENKIIKSDKGVFMRSKSERIIAARFDFYGVPYIYEQEIKLKSGKKIYPDFTLINPVTKEIIYWEHFGMMNDINYVNKNLNKLREYISNEIVPGKNLIVTFEDSYGIDIDFVNFFINEKIGIDSFLC